MKAYGAECDLLKPYSANLAQASKIAIGGRFRNAVRGRTRQKPRALRVHLRLDLLAHGAAKQIGFRQRIAGEVLADLLDLLLIGDDPEGLFQDRLQARVKIFDLLLAELARAIGRNVRHRTGPIERDQRDQVLEPVGAHIDQRAPHALTFNLEHADHVAASEHLVGLLVVERDPPDIQIDVALLEELHRDIEHCERFQAEKVEFHQSGRLDPFHVELGHRHVGFRIAVERHEFAQRTIRDHDAGGMGRGVPRQAFEALRDVESARHHRILVAKRLQLRLARQCRRQRHRSRGILRHQFCQLVDLAVGHLQHAPDVAQHAARLQRAEGDDLGDLIAPVALLHVADHLVAAILAEVDVEVGHRHAVGIEEALEDQAKPDRIEVGDGQRIGHQRARAGAAAGTDRNALRFRPLNEIGDDQEVAGIFHPLDDAEFETQAFAIFLLADPRRAAVQDQPLDQALLGLAAQFRGLVAF